MPSAQPMSARKQRAGADATAFIIQVATSAGICSGAEAMLDDGIVTQAALFNLVHQDGKKMKALLSQERSAIRTSFRSNVHGIRDTINKGNILNASFICQIKIYFFKSRIGLLRRS